MDQNLTSWWKLFQNEIYWITATLKSDFKSRRQKHGEPHKNAPDDIIHAKGAPAGAFTKKKEQNSINQSNFYSANIPAEARLSGVNDDVAITSGDLTPDDVIKVR